MFYCKTDYSNVLIIIATITVTCFLPQIKIYSQKAGLCQKHKVNLLENGNASLFNMMNSQHLLLANNGYQKSNLKN